MSPSSQVASRDKFVIIRQEFDAIVPALKSLNYEVWAPVALDGALVYEPIDSVAELPVGVSDEQAPGKYRLTERHDEALFQYASTAQSWKRLLTPPVNQFLEIRKENGSIHFIPRNGENKPRALLGMRACDLAAIQTLDRVFLEDHYPDEGYAARRASLLLIAVNCGYPSGTCFCDSMGTGPEAREGYDLALTEVLTGEHRFIVSVGSEKGKAILDQLDHRLAEAPDLKAEENVLRSARENMGRKLNVDRLQSIVLSQSDSKHWETVAARCLACTNCTMVCPTCFCMTVEDTNGLDGVSATRTRLWDSCFSLQYSYIHGGSVRSSVAARYRQWLTHKLASWHHQFGESGCVGCGRCVTWCPAGIDITREADALRQLASRGGN